MKKSIVFIPLLLGLASSPLYAGPLHERFHDRSSFDDKAKVVDVKPIIEVVRVPTEHRDCWDEEVRGYERGGGNGTGMLTGTIIGGVIGSQMGHGDGRRAATIAGTIIGAAVGHDVDRQARARPYNHTEHRCQVRTEYYEEERTRGYRVTYRYHGETFVTRMDHDPGPFVRVRVDVAPAGRW